MDMKTERLTLALKEAGLRLTPQRVAVCHLLAHSEEHPTAQEIYETIKPDFPSLSLATVYNTLEELVKTGAINSLGKAGDDAVHYDANTTPHVNLACIRCNRVIDFSSEHIQHVDDEVQASSGYQVIGARVLYYGLCPQCRQKRKRKGRRKANLE